MGTAEVGGHCHSGTPEFVASSTSHAQEAAAAPTMPMIQVNNSEGVQMPGVAPYLATAAIGAFFTTLASQTDQSGLYPVGATEGAPMIRTLSNNGIAVQS